MNYYMAIVGPVDIIYVVGWQDKKNSKMDIQKGNMIHPDPPANELSTNAPKRMCESSGGISSVETKTPKRLYISYYCLL
jgi:hypothetical protein